MDNFVKVEGTIATEIRLTYTTTAKAVASFMLNIGTDEKKQYFPCQAWEGVAEDLANLGKGTHIKVKKGHLYCRSWKKPDETWGRENGVCIDEFEWSV